MMIMCAGSCGSKTRRALRRPRYTYQPRALVPRPRTSYVILIRRNLVLQSRMLKKWKMTAMITQIGASVAGVDLTVRETLFHEKVRRRVHKSYRTARVQLPASSERLQMHLRP